MKIKLLLRFTEAAEITGGEILVLLMDHDQQFVQRRVLGTAVCFFCDDYIYRLLINTLIVISWCC